ncbi:103_t:CDS:2, partial [Racocetra fulgida]
ENWDTETLIIFLRGQNLNLDEDNYEILRKEKIDGQIFPDMTEKKFIEDGMKRGPAIKLDKQARRFKERTKALEKADISNQQEVLLPSAPIAGKKRSIGNIMDISIDVPLRKNGSINILEVLKVHGYEITGQWHLEQVCDDGSYHHYYCDLTIKKPDNPHPEALIELLATASVSKLNGHFDQVFKYAEHLCPQEVWIVHFSREDFVVTKPYWPSQKLQDRGESKDLSEVDSLKLENVRLMTRIAELEQIVKEKNALETELKQIIEENAEKAKLRDAELNARIMELERSAKENEERFVKLEQKQNNAVDRLENGDNSYENDNISNLVIKSLEDITPSSNITDDALSSDEYQESKIQCTISSIHTESKLPEDKGIEFLDRVHKERISNEIREKNREKKLRSQGLSSDNNSSEQSNSLYDVKTVTIETNPKSANLNIPEISSESKSPTNLLPNQKIPYNQKVER